MFENLSGWLSGMGDKMGGTEPNPGLASLLGGIGGAMSPQDSWQQRLNQTAYQMAQEEQARRYLAEILGLGEEEGEEGKKSTKSPKTTKPDKVEAPLTPMVLGLGTDYLSNWRK